MRVCFQWFLMYLQSSADEKLNKVPQETGQAINLD